ncbi:hypothetical protein CDD81_3692 [Ophiocordyceps australis]|uniref:3-hydroxyacyl-CoA dehydrogenase NAD binding domain-containing protein n=1 Tax=Ophiocordyceps australis TaxID=1399860 RepID=A0A2C5XRS1_9HYPO|nr:hypothetical protein CDD81_3692 [Ophiocordyceps australis]
MSSSPMTIGVVGTGVIGSSWIGLFLARGHKVLVSSPSKGSDKRLEEHLKSIWPTLKERGLAPGASLSNYKFVGTSLKEHYKDVDFIQENAPERVDLKNDLIAEIDAGYTCVTSSLGPRWAVNGPLESNALSSGGGADGFRHYLEHLGPAMQGWLKDMQANSMVYDTKSLDELSASVNKELQGGNIQEVERRRDQLLLRILCLKEE